MRPLVIGTRGSALALWQARLVQAKLQARVPAVAIRLETIKAQADQHPEQALAGMSGEGIFVKELETALTDRRVDLAVHSLKDLPLDCPPALCLGAVLLRDDPRDALISRSGSVLRALAGGSRVGTSSLRRQSQLLHHRRDLQCKAIRGNVETRLRKLDQGDFDAIIIAACGLHRLGLQARITEHLALEDMLPEPGQGALAVELRADDAELLGVVQTLEEATTRACVEAERSFLRGLGGGCRLPIAAHASCAEDLLTLDGAVIAPDGHAQVREQITGASRDPGALGARLAASLISRGALDLLK